MARDSGIERLKAWFLANKGEVADPDLLRRISGIQSYPRRIRELRGRLGWPIENQRDNPSLRRGEYVLVGDPPDEPPVQFSDRIPNDMRVEVLQRNNSMCFWCGRIPGDNAPDGRKVIMHVDHIRPSHAGGETRTENLRTTCSWCNEGGRDVQQERPPEDFRRIKAMLRNSTISTRADIYDWLKERIEREGQ